MRKLKLQMQLSLDGYVAGPNGELDWMTWNWDDAMKNYLTAITEPVDCIVLGRKLAQGFIPHWAEVAADPDNPEFTAGKKFTDTPKVIFTKTLDKPEWENTTLAKGSLVDEMNKIKNQAGKDIITYGGAGFVSALINHNLIDEYYLSINPVAIGEGLPIFNSLEKRLKLQLIEATPFTCGIVGLCYKPEK